MEKFIDTKAALINDIERRYEKLPDAIKKNVSFINGQFAIKEADGSRHYVLGDQLSYMEKLEAKAAAYKKRQKEKLKRKRIIARNRVIVGAAAVVGLAMAALGARVSSDYHYWKKAKLAEAGYYETIEARTGFTMIASKTKGNRNEIPNTSFGTYIDEYGLFLDAEERSML